MTAPFTYIGPPADGYYEKDKEYTLKIWQTRFPKRIRIERVCTDQDLYHLASHRVYKNWGDFHTEWKREICDSNCLTEFNHMASCMAGREV